LISIPLRRLWKKAQKRKSGSKVSDKNFFNYLALITQLGLVIIISILCGLFVGMYLDRKIGLKGAFTIIFVIFGAIGGFMAGYRLIKDLNSKDNE